MQKPVEECRGKCAVVVEDRWPVFVDAVGGDDDGAALIPFADDLEEEIGAVFVDRQIPELVDQEQTRLEILVLAPTEI